MQIPVPFRKQLRQVEQSWQAIGPAVESGDLERVRLAFRLLGASLDDVDAELLEGHPRMQWNELKMLLIDDVVIGRDVDQIADAQRVYQSLTGHMQRLRKQLMMSNEEHGDMAETEGTHSHE